jgi:26S proteasome regulatory subunit N1
MGENKILLADILSVMAMTMAPPNSRESLKFKLLNNVPEIGTWGHEYVRYKKREKDRIIFYFHHSTAHTLSLLSHLNTLFCSLLCSIFFFFLFCLVRHLATEIAAEYNQRKEEEKPVDDLNRLVDAIIPFDMSHNAEPEACDLLMEVEQLSKIVPHVDENNYSRVCLYLSSAANYLPELEDTQVLKIVLQIYKKVNQLPDALRIALRLNEPELVKEVYDSCEDRMVKKQLAFLLARQCHFSIVDDDAELNDIISNTRLSENFLNLARDLDIMEAKTPEDVYKSNADPRGFTTNVDSARANLASTFVNAFINAGFGQDKLMTISTEEGPPPVSPFLFLLLLFLFLDTID